MCGYCRIQSRGGGDEKWMVWMDGDSKQGGTAMMGNDGSVRESGTEGEGAGLA